MNFKVHIIHLKILHLGHIYNNLRNDVIKFMRSVLRNHKKQPLKKWKIFYKKILMLVNFS